MVYTEKQIKEQIKNFNLTKLEISNDELWESCTNYIFNLLKENNKDFLVIISNDIFLFAINKDSNLYNILYEKLKFKGNEVSISDFKYGIVEEAFENHNFDKNNLFGFCEMPIPYTDLLIDAIKLAECNTFIYENNLYYEK